MRRTRTRSIRVPWRVRAFDVLLVLRSPRNGLVDHQIFWSRDWCADLADLELVGGADRLDLEGQPRERHINIDAAGLVPEKQYLVGLSERTRVIDSWRELVLREDVEHVIQLSYLRADSRVDVARRAGHTASYDGDAADEHAGRGHPSQCACDGRNGRFQRCFSTLR